MVKFVLIFSADCRMDSSSLKVERKIWNKFWIISQKSQNCQWKWNQPTRRSISDFLILIQYIFWDIRSSEGYDWNLKCALKHSTRAGMSRTLNFTWTINSNRSTFMGQYVLQRIHSMHSQHQSTSTETFQCSYCTLHHLKISLIHWIGKIPVYKASLFCDNPLLMIT